ncbi:hypothetical protein ACJ2A9_03485 [Anaerobacillus sp. MEB173]|uniref:hypothetical protein n=1 Tax=Anaerobacillus sp. MEB173 TaxID=3383345 RepID=UPI003F90B7B2
MLIERGTEYKISEAAKSYFYAAEKLTITRQSGNIVQFTLGEGKSYGSMPLQHLEYLLKRNDLTEIRNKRLLLSEEHEEEQIG